MRRQEPADGMLAQATMWERTIMKPFTTEMIAEKLLLLGLTEVQQL